jgi:phosphopantothenoylcysteine decarboxylase
MANILLGVTGSVAAVRVPVLVPALEELGHAVKLVATEAATYFFDPNPWGDRLSLDRDEWPRREADQLYQRGDPVRHIELRSWADMLLIAPLDANTLAKFAVGLCDNCLTCVWRAWDWTKPVVLAPAMNTLMWQHPFTRKHLRSLAADFGAGHIPASFDEIQLVQQINDRAPRLKIVAPISKTLACGDSGIGAMAEVPEIVQKTAALLHS